MSKAAVVFFTLLISSLFAHTGANTSFTAVEGLLHPIGGMDHLLAMFAVGLFASMFAKKEAGIFIGLFVGVMMLSAYLGTFRFNIPFIEMGIAVSVVVFGFMIVFASNIGYKTALTAIGFFAIFHGYAHGYEFLQNGSLAGYMTGFSISTLTVHMAGLMAGMFLKNEASTLKNAHTFKIAGALIALTGLSFIA